MSVTTRLPVLLPNVPGQRWSCHSCGACCRTLVGHLFEHEREKLLQQGWAQKLGVTPVVRVGRGYALNKRPDGACVFLGKDNLCRIHVELGEEAKPLACRIFPFSLRPTPKGWQASLRFDCPSVAGSCGAPLSHHRVQVQQLAQLMPCPTTARDTTELQRGVPAEAVELEAMTARYARWLKRDELTPAKRLMGVARVTATLHEASLHRVRGARFVELLDMLFEALPAESAAPPAPSTPRARGLLRQLAFAHAEHVTLPELRSGIARLRARWRQFRAAGRFRKGAGDVPGLPGVPGTARFSAVESVRPNPEDDIALDDLIRRYLTARLDGQSVFGDGYYGWSVVNGLAALCLSVASAGWLARYHAAAAGRAVLNQDDAAAALGMVDRAATRLPALGAVSERARVLYLMRDDGLARLLGDYSLFAAT